MTRVHTFVFNPFSENTYLVYDDSLECIVVDPGCYTAAERQRLKDFITQQQLRPVRLLNTHCHIDHVFGNRFIAETYGLELEIHEGELPVLEAVPTVAQMYQIPNVQQSPDPDPARYLQEGATITFGNSELKILLTPGHSPASVSFYCASANFVLGGDVLFQGSIGRTDLPGGDYQTLMQSIEREFMSLPDDTVVYSGHGAATSIGAERRSNPFILEYNHKK
jgi:glyoxylase-like metal-dependent hydrolase (beta-lactamase superfamily II)